MADNVTNDTVPDLNDDPMGNPFALEVILMVVNILMFVGSIVGNGFVICIYFLSAIKKDTTLKVMLHLAITDFVSGCMVGYYFVSYVTGFIISSFLSCMMSEQSLALMMLVSQALLTISTLDRYISICHSTRYAEWMTNRNFTLLLVLSWVVPLILALIPFFGFNSWEEFQPECHYSVLLNDWVYQTYSTMMISMMLLSIVFYAQILARAHRFYKTIHPLQLHGNNDDNVQSAAITQKVKSIRNGRIMGIVTFLFIIFWLPFQIDQYNFGSNFFNSFSAISGRFTFTFGLLNSALNPFLYSFQKREIRAEATKMLKRIKFGRSNTNEQGDDQQTRRNEHINYENNIYLISKTCNEIENDSQ